MKRTVLALLIPILASAEINSHNQQLFRTLNLGNYLEAPNEGEWTNGARLTDADFKRIAEKGFSSVRIPVRWSNHLDDKGVIKPEFLARIMEVVIQANSYKLTAVIDDHHFDSLMTNPDLFEPVSISIWNQIGEAFQKFPDDSLFFEPVNEPHTLMNSVRWNQFHPKLVEAIRVKNPTRPIIIGTTGWGGITGLRDLILPNDPNLIATVHYYLPFQFTHQGAEWVEGGDEWLGTKWNGDFLEKRILTADIDEILAWSSEQKRPVFIGEFGAYNQADLDSRLRWSHFCAKLFESRKLPWAYWEYSQGFGLYNLTTNSWNPGLADTLLSADTATLKIDSSSLSFGDQMVINEYFTGKSGWTHNVYGGAKAVCQFTAEGAVHTVSELGLESYNVQLLQSGISLLKDQKYLLSLTFSSENQIPVSVGIMRKDYSSVASSGTIVSGQNNKTLDLLITPTADEPNLTLAINLGHAKGTITLKSISLRPINTTSIVSENEMVCNQSILFSGRTISFAEPIRQSAELKLFSAQGKQIYRHTLSGMENQISFPKEIARGWYAVTITASTGILFRGASMIP